MKHATRLFAILTLVALLVTGPLLTAFAQDAPNCTGLNDADCQVIKDSMAAMRLLKSFSVPAWSLAFDVQAGEESMALAASGSGAVVLPPSLVAWLSDMPPVTTPANLDPVIAQIQALDSAMIQQALAELGFYLAIEEASLVMPGQSASGSADILVKDNGLYLRFESPAGTDAWFGKPFDLSESDLSDIDDTLAEVVTMLQSDDTQAALAQVSEFSGTIAGLQALVSQYVVTTRQPDVEMMGQSMRVFATDFDLTGFLSDPALADLLHNLLQNPALGELGVDLGDVQNVNQTQIQFMLMTAGMLLGDTSISMEQAIGTDDSVVHHVAFDASVAVDLSLFGSGADFDTVTIAASFEADMADVNTATLDGVAVPTDYYSLDDTGKFLVGSPDMIDAALQVGQTYSAAFQGDGDDQHIYALALNAGDTVQFELASDDYPYLTLYGPDGFEVTSFDTYYDDPMIVTAESGGQYLVVVEASWSMKYDLTIRRS